MDLELRHLRCLVAIVDSGTFTDAAIELGISQAAVSRNLMALEQVLGVRLLHRTSRSITPTTAGVHALNVQMIWRRHDPHPSTHAAVALLTDLYRPRGRSARPEPQLSSFYPFCRLWAWKPENPSA